MFIVEVNGKYNEKFVEFLLQQITTDAEFNLLLFNHDQINVSINKNKIKSGNITFTDLSSLIDYLKNHNIEAFTLTLSYDSIIKAVDFVKKIENEYSKNLLSIRIDYIIEKTIYEKKFYED